MRTTFCPVAFMLLLGLQGTANAQVVVQPASPTKTVRWDPSGNIVLPGACYSKVSPLPAGEVTMFGNKAVVFGGNLYVAGTIYYDYVGTFPAGVKFQDGSVVLATVTSQGDLYLRGRCVKPPPVSVCSYTKWEPARWAPPVEYYNNCYNYGNDTITNTYAQPGLASTGTMCSSQQLYDPSCVQAGAISDGLVWIGWAFPGNQYQCADGGHIVFLAIAPGYDYHWWRLDRAHGTWSHKPGGTPVRNTDGSNNTISNPLLANRGGYTVDGGFFCTCGGNANIE